jgi:hypothetical protein
MAKAKRRGTTPAPSSKAAEPVSYVAADGPPTPAESKPEQPERFSYFVPSTDPNVTTCDAWKSLMQFRHELLTNPRQDSGAHGWWSMWIGTMQRCLYGGGDWGEGYYAPSHRDSTPDCAVCLAMVKRRLHAMFSSDDADEEDADDDNRTMCFPANTTYVYRGFVIDWSRSFPPIAERGPLVEWVESWIDRIQYTEATGRYPWEPDAPLTTKVSPDLQGQLQRAAAAVDPRAIARAFGGGDNGDVKPTALPAEAHESAGPALTPNQARVLQTMNMFEAEPLVSAAAIAAEMQKQWRLSERTIGPIVRKLIDLGLAERPEGERSGARLTMKGRRLASKIAD